MIPAPTITDHALLRWMERVHGVDIEGWRRLMQDEIRCSLGAYEGRYAETGPAFILNASGEKVVTVLGPGQAPSIHQLRTVVLARVA